MRFASASGVARPSRSYDRRTVDPDLLREYDTFGPWIGEIRSAQDMPRRFRDHHPANAGATWLLKLPLDLDRRTVVPGQDLYGAVLAVHEDHLRLLELRGADVVETRVSLRDVVAVSNHTCLLLGILRLHLTGGGAFELSYNTTSQPLVNGVIDFVRRRLSPAPVARQPGARPDVASYHFLNLIAEQERRGGPCEVVHCEVPGQVFTDARGRRRRAGGFLALDSGGELIFLVTGKPVAADFEHVYALDRTHVPRRAVHAHQVCELRGRWGRRRRVLRLQVSGGHVLEFPMWHEGGRLRALLERLAASRTQAPDGVAGSMATVPA